MSKINKAILDAYRLGEIAALPEKVHPSGLIESGGRYNVGEPESVIVHWIGSRGTNAVAVANYNRGNIYGGFTHNYISGTENLASARDDEIAWGAGTNGNGYTLQFELTWTQSKHDFMQQTLTAAMWLIDCSKCYPRLNIRQVGYKVHNTFFSGVQEHGWVSRNMGGTDHVDCRGYWYGSHHGFVSPVGRWFGEEYSIEQFVALIDELCGVDRQEGISKKRVQRLYLPSDAKGWNVYRAGGSWSVGHQVGRLQPAKFGGLDYEILAWKIPGVVAVIKTHDFGIVGIYVAAGTGAVIE